MSVATSPLISPAAFCLQSAVQLAAPRARIIDAAAFDPLLIDPPGLRIAIEERLRGHVQRVRVAGTLDRRLLLLETRAGRWTVADLSGQPHASRQWPDWSTGHLELHDPSSWLSAADIDDYAVTRLSRPHVLIAALYHPENFPLPRFPLGISDVARAARSTLSGQVCLTDMQLGVKLNDIVHRIITEAPDIVGISATFGQHDLMTNLLDTIYELDDLPLVIAGGSLTARNEALLLRAYPDLLIARGAGEATIRDVIAHWHGDIDKTQIRGIGYAGAAHGTGTMAIGRRHTARPVSAGQGDFLPELDLLPATFAHHGVAQLEASRGCTNFCSFCPRGHKGQWFGGQADAIGWILDELRRVFDRHPAISRTLYLVDEEFIGRGDDAVPRALAMARKLHDAGFKWETSCRVDQVVHLDHDRGWHQERAQMWRDLLQAGLRRCLFGVESGVDSILRRFNKETTGDQNALAIRTLSALGVPTRFTYISFDPLMTFEELKRSYDFQGRTDLLLKAMPGTPVDEIVAGVRNPEWVAGHTTGRPLHTAISYMLVSMECLIGAAYTKKAQAAGLTGDVHPSMGRQDARYADWRIGVASRWAQRWVDRHFALDYTFKSLEKILDGASRAAVRRTRVVLKDAAYNVFGHMITAIEATHLDHRQEEELLDATIRTALEREHDALAIRMAAVVHEVSRAVPDRHARLLHREHHRWTSTTDWHQINASDPCGT